jgi:mannose-6-phosphate isomerase-like protein (cupin superfamily)
VIAGTGTFVHAGERTPFQAGDTLFVRAGIPHRFEDFTPDFSTWVFFWGPKGGE